MDHVGLSALVGRELEPEIRVVYVVDSSFACQ